MTCLKPTTSSCPDLWTPPYHPIAVQPQTWLILVAMTTVPLAAISEGGAGLGPSAMQMGTLILTAAHLWVQWQFIRGPGTMHTEGLVPGSRRASPWSLLLGRTYRGLKPESPGP